MDKLGGLGFAQQLRTGFTRQFDPIKFELGKFANALGERGRNARLSNDYDTARKLVVLNLSPTASAGTSVAHVSSFQGGWQTITNQNGHFNVVLQIINLGPETMNGMTDMRVVGQILNTDGAAQYNGSLQGVIPRGTRTLHYSYVQPGISGGGTGQFTLSQDGNAITGSGKAGDVSFTWNGTRIQTKARCPSGMRGENCEEMIVN